MRSIGIPVADRSECVVALDVALNLGKSLGADVIGYHLRPDPKASDRIDVSSLWGGGLPYSAWPVPDADSAEVAAVSARKLFEDMAERHGLRVATKRGVPGKPAALYREKAGSPDRLLPLIGPVNDLLVVSRPRKGGGNKAWLIMMSALLDSCTPVLVLPQKPVQVDCRRVAIAWNRGRAETLLVHHCLPLLKAAEDVVLITEGRDHQHGASERDMAEFLQGHGVRARCRKVEGTGAAKTLVRAAQEEKASVLLSGAYTKGRMRQLLFGGVTEHLLTGTEFPVILLHP